MPFASRIICSLLLISLFGSNLQAQLTDERVRTSLEAGKRYLLSKQQRDGSWRGEFSSFPTGVSSLCTLALLNAGMTADDPEIQRALNFLRKQNLDRTYTVSLQTIVLCTAEPNRDLEKIRRNVGWLTKARRLTGDGKGAWGYSDDKLMQFDPSNAQFALLALYEADRVGVRVKDAVWRLALDYWKRIQKNDGSYAYSSEAAATGSMTCAGIGSLIISSGQVSKLDAKIEDGSVQCCVGTESVDDSIEKAFDWLGDNFSVRRNPAMKRLEGLVGMRHYYYLYALERVGRLAGRRFIGDHDWYREGVEVLLDLQDDLQGYWGSKDRLTCTSFSVLFLSKGRRPILLSKIKRLPNSDWNHHRHDAAHLTRYVEKRWKQDLTWQVVDLASASAEDLLQSPVLFISGRDALDVAMEEKEALKTYIQMGGFVFAESCGGVPGCDDIGFDRDFRALMKELFPDRDLQLLPKDHAIWFAEQQVDPEYMRPLEGINACCRTGVVYSPRNLSCYWELAKPQRGSKEQLPEKIQAEVDACLAIGANVVTYATGRELRKKLDQTEMVSVVASSKVNDRAALHIAKLLHNGGSDDAPLALSNAIAVIGQQTDLPVSPDKRLLSPIDENLPDYPIAFVHGRRSFRWSKAERAAIRRFVENGGVLFADAICAEDEFAKSFRNEMKEIFKSNSMVRVPPSHGMFTDEYQGHDVRTVTLRDPRKREDRRDRLSVRTEEIAPLLEGIEMDGRFVVLLSPYDISCALENQPSLECRGYAKEDAFRLVTNIVLYAMQQ